MNGHQEENNLKCDGCKVFLQSIKKKNHRIQALEEENYIISSKNKSITDENRANNLHTSPNRSKNGQVEKLEAENNDLRCNIKQLLDDKSNLQVENARLSDHLNELKQRQLISNDQIRRLENEKTYAMSQKESIEGKYERLKNKMNQMKSDRNTFSRDEQNYNELEQHNQWISNEYNNLNNELYRKNQEIKALRAKLQNRQPGGPSIPPPNNPRNQVQGRYLRALIDYNPNDDSQLRGSDIRQVLQFKRGTILSLVSPIVGLQDDGSWPLACLVNFSDESLTSQNAPMYIPPDGQKMQSVERKRKRNSFFSSWSLSKAATQFDTPELKKYEEVLKVAPFKRGSIILVGANGNFLSSLMISIVSSNPSEFACPVISTSKRKQRGEQNNERYHFLKRKNIEKLVSRHNFIEYEEQQGDLNGVSFDDLRNIQDGGKTPVLTPRPESLKLLRDSSEFRPFVVFLESINGNKMSQTRNGNRSRNSFRKSTKRAHVGKILDENNQIRNIYYNYIDFFVEQENLSNATTMILNEWNNLARTSQWVPTSWTAETQSVP